MADDGEKLAKLALWANLPFFIVTMIVVVVILVRASRTSAEVDAILANADKTIAELDQKRQAAEEANAVTDGDFEGFSTPSRAFISGPGHTIDSPPAEGDKSTWAYAYRLLHPDHDRSERARTAIRLITRDRELSEVPPRELSLLFTAYNELGDADKQFDIAMELWKHAPGTRRALDVVASAMHWRYSPRRESAPVIEFVDKEVARRNGGERELLLLKASVMLWDEEPSEDQRAAAGDVLISALRYDRAIDPAEKYQFEEPPENFVNYTEPFCSVFTPDEKEVLLRRIKETPTAEKHAPKAKADPNE